MIYIFGGWLFSFELIHGFDTIETRYARQPLLIGFRFLQSGRGVCNDDFRFRRNVAIIALIPLPEAGWTISSLSYGSV